MSRNKYLPFLAEIKAVIKHTETEYTFRLAYDKTVKPGQFFEVSLPKYGEAPISVSGIGAGMVDLTIRRVGKVTQEIFTHGVGDKLFLRGPYGNGFDINHYKHKELLIIVGGTGLAPVKGIIDYFYDHPQEAKNVILVAGFKSPQDILFKEDISRWKEKMKLIVTVDHADGDDGNYQVGLVTKYLPQLEIVDIADAVAIITGPPVMMKVTAQGLLDRGMREENLWISKERKMCCGIGKCGHCKIDDTYVCLDGPVFNYLKGKQLID